MEEEKHLKFEEYLKIKRHKRESFWRRLYYRLFPWIEYADIVHDLEFIEKAYVELLAELEELK